LKFRLHGNKLQGEFALVHIKNNGKSDNAWLLIKHRDAFASSVDITKKNKSVVSGKTIVQMGKTKKAKPVKVKQRKKESYTATAGYY
jgi:bifunctional non-homologous end joining protein LigD